MGGGFGLAGALEGMGIAALLNAATTTTTIHTFIQILTLRGEMFFHCGSMGPAALRMFLSPVFTRLRQQNLGALLGEIERMAALRARDMITEEEFAQLKTFIIGQYAPSAPQAQHGTTERTATNHADRPLPSWPVRDKAAREGQ